VFLNVTSSSPAMWVKAVSYMSCGRPVHPSVLDSLMPCKAVGWDHQVGARGRKCHESKPTVMLHFRGTLVKKVVIVDLPARGVI
jgi:hypothetical protein